MEDTNPTGVMIGTSPTISLEEDPQPRLLGLSQPFFVRPLASSERSSNAQVEALDRFAVKTSALGKFRVLVAEDNLVNQEVVLG